MHLQIHSRQPISEPHPTPLLFVHGGSHDAWYWTNFLDYFADHGYASYAPDLRGHGGSEGRRHLRWTRLSDYVQDVAQVAAQLPQPPVVIGHSLGGLVVQKYLENNPAAAGILLASAPPAGAAALLLRTARQHPIAFLYGTIALNPRLLYRSPRLFREILFSADCSDEIVNESYRRLQDESWLATLETVYVLPQPRRIQVPMLVLGAADAGTVTKAEVEATAQAYRTQAVIFPNMPHHMTLVPAWPAVADYMLAWLADYGF